MARKKKVEGPPSKCEICRAEDKPSFVAWELGFVIGAKVASSKTGQEMAAFVEGLCDSHATSLSRIMANRVKA